ncbi:MAG: hypothetical protein WAN01_03465, partial [Bradyrhizobium sp.]
FLERPPVMCSTRHSLSATFILLMPPVELGLPRFHVRIAGLLCHGSVARCQPLDRPQHPTPISNLVWGKASRVPGSELDICPRLLPLKRNFLDIQNPALPELLPLWAIE